MKKIILAIALIGLIASCQKESVELPSKSYKCVMTKYDTMVVSPNTVSVRNDTFIFSAQTRLEAEERCNSFSQELQFPNNVWFGENVTKVKDWMTAVFTHLL
jgi:hypothetical protein